MDGSPHAWLEDRGPWLCLISSIDDATGTVPAALFREHEDSQGYLLLLHQIVATAGRPVAVYHDRHSIVIPPSQQQLTVEEQLVVTNATTQVHRAMAALDIRSISAHSPQAKGRIERLFATLQDRLVAELRLANITTCAGANTFLATFLPRYNAQFGVPARELGRAYRPLESGCDLEQICCFVYYRTVAADNTVRLGEYRIQIQPGPGRMSYAKTRVEVQERLDGAVAVYYRGQCLATKAAPAEGRCSGPGPSVGPLLSNPRSYLPRLVRLARLASLWPAYPHCRNPRAADYYHRGMGNAGATNSQWRHNYSRNSGAEARSSTHPASRNEDVSAAPLGAC